MGRECPSGGLAGIPVNIASLVSTFEPFPAYPPNVPLPETISVRYTEEEAGYVTVRPLVRQTFRMDELLDMILSVAGKDAQRVHQLLQSGTVVYHFFRYTWTGFDADQAELAAALAQFPNAEPSRPFAAGQCTNAIFDSAGTPPRHLLDMDRDMASKHRLFRGQSFWDGLLEIAGEENLQYEKYSYGRRADLYRLDLDAEITSRIAEVADRLATGKLRAALRVMPIAASLLLVCPRSANAAKA